MSVTRNLRAPLERLEFRAMLASWQNPNDNFDVDRSGHVSPTDALLVVNRLNQPTRSLLGAPSASDPLVDVNADGRVSPIDVLLIINGLNSNGSAPILSWSIPPALDPNSNGVVQRQEVQIVGQTMPNATLTVQVSSLDNNHISIDSREAIGSSDSAGSFTIDTILFHCLNQITVKANNGRGRILAVKKQITLADHVSDWNAAILNVVRDWTTTSDDPYEGRIVPSAPPVVARNLAMIHTAMFDAMAAADGQFEGYLSDLQAPPATSANAAGISAAYEVAKYLYPKPRDLAVWETTLLETLAVISEGETKQSGIEFGRIVAQKMIEQRLQDGSELKVNHPASDLPGQWNRTAPDFLPPLLPQWGSVKPFAIDDVDSFVPPAPPDLGSEEYAVAVDEVHRLGGFDSKTRTADQTAIAVFWADGGGTATPPGHWNRIAVDASLYEQQSSLERARTLALLNLALADAAIASWKAKYEFSLWRPIDAIRQADIDGNSATIADTNWLPLLRTPPFPSYTSGHSTFSGAAAAVLTRIFGDNYSFVSQSDGHSGLTQRPVSTTTREFSSFQQAAQEAGMSRIYGGIHYSFDNTAGLEIGEAIGTFVVDRFLLPA